MEDPPEYHKAVARLLEGGSTGLPAASLAGFADFAARHRMAAYLSTLASGEPGLREKLRPMRARDLAAATFRESWLGPLLRDAAARGATPTLFKGLGVALCAYPAPEMRPLGDVDLLTDPSTARAFVALARETGFRYRYDDPLVVAYNWDWSYVVELLDDRRGSLEVHHALWRDVEPAFVAAALQRSVQVVYAGCPVPCLEPADLWLALAAHFFISQPGSDWVWMLDLVLLGRRMDDAAWERLVATARRHGLEVFAAAGLDTMGAIWNVRVAPDAVARELAAALTPRERRAAAAIAGRALEGRATGDELSMARRLSGRPVGGRHGVLTSLIVHPGAVCVELGVSSRSPWFFLHRVRHAVGRVARAVRAIA